MREAYFENQGTNTYLVYELDSTDEIDSMSLGMLTNNPIPGFASASFMQMDQTKYIKYNVSAKVSASQLFSGAVNRKRLLGVFSGIVSSIISAEEYMIDPQMLIMNMDYIFVDVTTCETVLVCLPVVQKAENVDLNMFFKNIMFSTQFDQTENCDYIAQIINFLNASSTASAEQFQHLLETLKAGPKAAAPKIQSAPVVNKPQPVVQPKAIPVQQMPMQKPAGAVSEEAAPMPERKLDMAVPGKARKADAGTEKKITFMYLMQHYNKENAALYKEQKEQKKAGGKAEKPASKKTDKKKKAPAAPKNTGAHASFAVPGQMPRTPMAVEEAQQAVPVKETEKAVPAAATSEYMPASQPASVPSQIGQTASRPLNFGETTVLGGGSVGETTVLSNVSSSAKADAHLIRISTGERININKSVFRIGKERSYVDYFVGDNSAISRSHANIIERDGCYAIVDTNSTNHTYVNGEMIKSNMETLLTHGMHIKLANEEFEFRAY